MKLLIVLVSSVLACHAAPQLLLHPAVYGAWPYVSALPAVSQYHAQDALGQYSYGYSGGPSAKSEVKTLDGVTRGSYSYIDADSKLQTVQYVADSLGFRVAATNLPQPAVDTNVAPVNNDKAPKQVEDTVEVKQARAEHLAAVALAKGESSDPELPEAPEDTPEVQQAREEHLQAVEEAKVRNQQAPVAVVASQPQVIQSLPAAVHLAHSPYVLAAPGSGFAYAVGPGGLTHVISA